MKALFHLVALLLFNTPFIFSQELLIKDGQKIGFMGDSITAQGWNHNAGYIKLITKALEEQNITIKPIPAGVGGNKSNQMLARLEKDVLAKGPDWMTLSCGVNDVWHGARGVPLEQYKKNIQAILDKCLEKGVKVILLTPTMIGETNHPNWNELNKKLEPYVTFLNELAKTKNLPIADLNKAMKKAVTEMKQHHPNRRVYLTTDGVHMNPLGNMVIARGILKTLGFNSTMLQKAQQTWDQLNVDEMFKIHLTLKQYTKYSKLSNENRYKLYQSLNNLFKESLDKITQEN